MTSRFGPRKSDVMLPPTKKWHHTHPLACKKVTSHSGPRKSGTRKEWCHACTHERVTSRSPFGPRKSDVMLPPTKEWHHTLDHERVRLSLSFWFIERSLFNKTVGYLLQSQWLLWSQPILLMRPWWCVQWIVLFKQDPFRRWRANRCACDATTVTTSELLDSN